MREQREIFDSRHYFCMLVKVLELCYLLTLSGPVVRFFSRVLSRKLVGGIYYG
jgi:hypothetical protein